MPVMYLDRWHRWAAAALCAVSLSATAEAPLNGKEIRTLYSDTKVTAVTPRGQDYVGRYYANGTMEGSVADGKYTDKGTWEVDGDRFCRTWTEWANGSRSCFQIIALGGGEYRSVEGGGKGSSTFKAYPLD